MYKITFLFILTILFSDLNLYCDEIIPEVKKNPKKSYAIAFTGSLVNPIIGHAYIGGKNTKRGVLYTGGEIFNFFASIPRINWGPNAKPGDNEFDKGSLYWIAAIHLISIIDAMISVHDFNTGTSRKSYFISTAGSAVLPIIGHSYIGENNYRRGALYSMGEFAALHYDRNEYIMGIRLISMADALYSTKKINDKSSSVIFLPGIKSAKILITKSF